MSRLKVAFWNLQNLFDTVVSDIAADLDFTPDKGWDEDAFNHKVTNLATIIRSLFEGNGPDLLGICEIENRKVADILLQAIGRDDYKLAHVESPDIRGIDTSLIYSDAHFELLEEPQVHLVHLRYPTRDIFQVNLRVRENGAELMVVVNHWPSRWRGLYETEPYRITVASYCGRIIDELLKFPRKAFLAMPDTEATLERLNERWNRNILLMGDFNDEPFNRSLLDELQASSGEDKLEEALKASSGRETPSPESYLNAQAYLFNGMWPFLGRPDVGTHYFSQAVNTMNVLDQFIFSRGLYYGLQGLKLDPQTIEIVTPEVMTTRKGRPKAFDKESKKGFSDHFPIAAFLDTL
jgi:hypothetical protein